MKVPSVLLTPVAVTRENVAATVVKDGFYDRTAAVYRASRAGVPAAQHPVTGVRGFKH